VSDKLPPPHPGATDWDQGAIVEFKHAGNYNIDLRRCGRCAALVGPRDTDDHATWHYVQDRLFQMIRIELRPS